MDPNAALAEIRTSSRELRDQDDDDTLEGSQLGNLLDHLDALDDWLTRRGFLPRAWER
jgi:hypothetical protein